MQTSEPASKSAPDTVIIPVLKGRLSRAEVTILAAHVLLAAAFTGIGLATSNDPGFGDLARMVIVMLAGAWMVVVGTAGVIARSLSNQSLRYIILVLGPPALMAGIIGFIRAG